MDDDRQTRIENKIDKLHDRLGSIDMTLAKQEVNLTLHMKRSDHLEAQIEPIKEHIAMIQGAIKFGKWIAIAVVIPLIGWAASKLIG